MSYLSQIDSIRKSNTGFSTRKLVNRQVFNFKKLDSLFILKYTILTLSLWFCIVLKKKNVLHDIFLLHLVHITTLYNFPNRKTSRSFSYNKKKQMTVNSFRRPSNLPRTGQSKWITSPDSEKAMASITTNSYVIPRSHCTFMSFHKKSRRI